MSGDSVTVHVAGLRTEPLACANRTEPHPLEPPNVARGWRPCACPQNRHGGHTTYRCLACGAVTYSPPCWWAEQDAADVNAGLEPAPRGLGGWRT